MMLTPRLARSIQAGTVIAGGLAVSTLGAAVLILAKADMGAWVIIVGIAVLALGTGPLFALGTGLIMGSVPPERAGSAAAMAETSNFLGGALGLAFLGSVGAAIYRYQMDGSMPEGIPADAAEKAGQTVAGAADVASGLPANVGDELLRQAHEAFNSGFNVVGAISTVIFLLLTVLALVHFRQPSHPTDAESAPATADSA